MDIRTLASTVSDIEKAVADNQDSSIILAMMVKLKNASPPSEENLRTTKAGKTMRKIAKMGLGIDPGVRKMAGTIVVRWKHHVDRAKEGKAFKNNLDKVIAHLATHRAAKTSPYQGSRTESYTGDPFQRHFTTDQVDLEGQEKSTGNEIRDGAILVLYNGLAYGSTQPIEKVLARAMECEKAALAEFKGVTQRYRTKCRGFLTALKRRDSKNLSERVMAGEITAQEFVSMELSSAEQRALDEALKRDNMNRAQVPMAEKAVSSTFKCTKCGQCKVSYTQAQTRSADEPMTTFCECTNCGNRWKF